jgi:hypothetical protein
MKCLFIFSFLLFVAMPRNAEEKFKPATSSPEMARKPWNEPWLSFAPTPKYFKMPLKLQMPAQDGHTCLPSIMSFLNNEQCGGSLTTEYFIEQYESTHPGLNVEEDGIVGSKTEIIGYIESNFKTMSYRAVGGLVASINAGQPLMTTIYSFDEFGQQQAHNVLVIGYDSSAVDFNPRVYYMDPRYGNVYNDLTLLQYNSSSPLYVLSISGCRQLK